MRSPLQNTFGRPLTEQDLADLQKCFIAPVIAQGALLTRVHDPEARDALAIVAGGNYAGILYPYTFPGGIRIANFGSARRAGLGIPQ